MKKKIFYWTKFKKNIFISIEKYNIMIKIKKITYLGRSKLKSDLFELCNEISNFRPFRQICDYSNIIYFNNG